MVARLESLVESRVEKAARVKSDTIVFLTMGFSLPWTYKREFPPPSLYMFVALQMLDVLTTLIGLRMGAGEGSVFLSQLMQLNPVTALLLGKIFAVFLVATALRFKRGRIVVFVNFWFTAVVTWNLGIILYSLWRHVR
jgi:hypothetical protein